MTSSIQSGFKIVMTVDLASRFSAVCIMDANKKVLEEFDSWGKSAFAFLDEIIHYAEEYNVDVIVIEDVPYGLSKQFMIKPVLRLQGVFILGLGRAGLLGRTVFLNPSTWQRTFEGVFKGKDIGAAKAAAALGYLPPDMLKIWDSQIPLKGPERTKMRAQLKKAVTDYVDAFLMAEFTLTFNSVEEMLAYTGIQEASI
jgi:hypothetical protein